MTSQFQKKSYDTFAPYYDLVVGDRHLEAAFLRRILCTFAPHASTLLELGCGTGSMLSVLSRYYTATGIDRSAPMLKIARRKAPRVTLVQADITSFSVEEDFDAVICPFDTMNHITSLVAWRKVFLNVHQHLRRSGVFVFDINTKAKMESYRDEPKVLLSEDCTTIVEVKKTSEHRYRVLHKVFERERGDRFALHEMQIAEYVPPAATIRRELMRFFKRLIVLDPDRARPSAASEELFFICLGPRDL